MKIFIGIFSILFLMLSAYSQSNTSRIKLSETDARNQLKIALSDTILHNVISTKSLIIKDKETAISVVEPVLFEVYKKKNIVKQKPYEVYFIDNYWIISGTLPKNYVGGTFLIIIDATNSKIIRLTHGK